MNNVYDLRVVEAPHCRSTLSIVSDRAAILARAGPAIERRHAGRSPLVERREMSLPFRLQDI
jgi:hypothetical protein